LNQNDIYVYFLKLEIFSENKAKLRVKASLLQVNSTQLALKIAA